MTRVLLTGMCTSADRLMKRDSTVKRSYEIYPPRVRTKRSVINEFETAGNLGNYLITEGAFLALNKCNVDYIPFWALMNLIETKEIDDVASNFDVCVFAVANILHVDFKLEAEIKFFSSWKKPIAFMSVGIQKIEDLRGSLQPHTKLLLDVLGRANVTVFARGPSTTEFLRSRGIKNVIEACCPSAYAYPDALVNGLHSTKQVLCENLKEVWVSGYLGDDPGSVVDIREISKIAKNVKYIYQDEPRLFNVLGEFQDNDDVFNDYKNAFKTNPQAISDMPVEKCECLAFFSPEVWRARANSIDLSVGRRFHGNLIALQAGRPAIFVVHDDRVSDMTSALGVPTITIDEWTRPPGRADVIKDLVRQFDAAKAEDQYRLSQDRFLNGLRVAGLD